jgi:hypothetical protein
LRRYSRYVDSILLIISVSSCVNSKVIGTGGKIGSIINGFDVDK